MGSVLCDYESCMERELFCGWLKSHPADSERIEASRSFDRLPNLEKNEERATVQSQYKLCPTPLLIFRCRRCVYRHKVPGHEQRECRGQSEGARGALRGA